MNAANKTQEYNANATGNVDNTTIQTGIITVINLYKQVGSGTCLLSSTLGR